MSRHTNDRRVSKKGRGYEVTAGGKKYGVLYVPVAGWGVYQGFRSKLVQMPGGPLMTGYGSADEAIAAALEMEINNG